MPTNAFPSRSSPARPLYSKFLPHTLTHPFERIPMKPFPLRTCAATLLLSFTSALHAHAPLPLWPQGAPGAVTSEPETIVNGHLQNVSRPTLEFLPAPLPEGQTAPVVLVAPGGAYQVLAYDKEGLEIGRWLNTLGFHAAVLKYRIPNNREGALQDARQALALLREHTAAWHIRPNAIGMIGFSAGAHLTARLLAQENHGLAFALFIYPAYLSQNGQTLAPDVLPAKPHVPTFIAQCRDDRAYVFSSLGYMTRAITHNLPVSLRLYANGGHGFGLRRKLPAECARWPEDAANWLRALP